MNNKYTTEIKQQVLARRKSGEPVIEISENTEISVSTIYSWLKEVENNSESAKTIKLFK